MRAIDVLHQGRERVICCWEVDGVLIDPGPGVTEETLLAALDGAEPRALLLTHIHFDHAGVSGALVRRWPELPVYVHERGAPHMADPSRLMASAGRLYGGDVGLRQLWGEMVPVPEANLRVLSGGERDIEGAFRVEYTPGHASHHVSYLHEPSGWAFVGDVGGAKIPPHDFTVAPTPPPDIDVTAWERSIALVRAWKPAGLGLTHFGPVEDADAQLDRCLEALHTQVELEGGHDEAGFVAAMEARVSEAMGPDAATMIQATPLDQLHMGLARWRKKFGA
ncbi:MBL fold metallo-hydrolase [Solirubrobacter ginsenosidimutans]|uniref:MBL fold metallo-hydrolase n=1 Tax=Solirubrobacter ginsenosidimutans TaxID=490573 RepID=A0A9X3MTV4_9ACTN|nr:MBL fold metallo-hydrolase [Solirubrobacter ginsenosidimutans]MDA0161771.1 MBL fold metallo-hydrolase [Solirubrobacter ginsenosidimutans]